MHQVKRAIIMAAGTGSRMRPITLHTPKPLIPVKGTRMIDTVIRALNQNGITETTRQAWHFCVIHYTIKVE